MKKYLLLPIIAILASCTFGLYNETLYDDGKNPVYQAVCNGQLWTLGSCYKLAYQQCGGEFEIITQDKYNAGTTVNSSYQSGSYSNYSYNSNYNGSIYGDATAYNIINRAIIYKCKK